MPEVSVIVPVYNVEKYLRKCLDSILKQTFQDIEVILIDDGSLDKSSDICIEYSKNSDKVRYIRQDNGGLGNARNHGIRMALGKYIMFVDGDDYIAEDMIETLYHHITTHEVDMSTCGICNVFQKKGVPQCNKIEQFMCSGEEAFGLLLVGEKIPGSACNKLICREILEGIRFPEGVLYEDVKFHTELMQKVKNVYVDTTPLYYYVHRENSITTQGFNAAAMSFILFYEDTLRVVNEKYPGILTEARFKLLWSYFALLDRILQEEKYWTIPEYGKIKTYLRRNTIRVLGNPYFGKARKIGAVILFFSVRLYRKIIMENNKRSKGIIA